MNSFNPDNDRSLEVRRHILDMTNHFKDLKNCGIPFTAVNKRYMKDAAETYAHARGIVPHTNLKWLDAKFKAQRPTYLCRCGEHHPIHDLAVKTSINLVKGLIECVDDHELPVLEDLQDFYTKSMFEVMVKNLLTHCVMDMLVSRKRNGHLTHGASGVTITN